MLRLHFADRPTEALSAEHVASGGDAVRPLPSADDIRAALWVDLSFPLAHERRAVEEVLGIELPTKADMAEIEASSRVYRDGTANVMNLLLVVGVDSGAPAAVPVSLILTPERLVTVRYSDPTAFRALDQQCVRSSPGASAPMLLVQLLEHVVDRTADILERMGEEVDALSGQVFGLEQPAGARISNTDLQQILRRIGRTQLVLNKVHDSLVTLLRAMNFLQVPVTEEGGVRARADKQLRETYKSVTRDIMSLSETSGYLTQNVGFLLDAALGRISIEQNAIVKIFSVAAVIFLPPTLVASVYGMNFEFMPELGWQFGYPLALALMVLSAVGPYLYFKRRGWL
jgi:magnesium transporter